MVLCLRKSSASHASSASSATALSRSGAFSIHLRSSKQRSRRHQHYTAAQWQLWRWHRRQQRQLGDCRATAGVFSSIRGRGGAAQHDELAGLSLVARRRGTTRDGSIPQQHQASQWKAWPARRSRCTRQPGWRRMGQRHGGNLRRGRTHRHQCTVVKASASTWRWQASLGVHSAAHVSHRTLGARWTWWAACSQHLHSTGDSQQPSTSSAWPSIATSQPGNPGV